MARLAFPARRLAFSARRLHLSAAQSVTAYLIASLVAASAFPLISLEGPVHTLNLWSFWFRAFLSFAPLILGFYATIQISNHIEAAIAEELWPENEILSLRITFQSIVWRGILAAMILASFIAIYAGYHYRAAAWFLITFCQSLTRLQHAFRIPKNTPPPSIAPSTALPLQSTHWGNHA